MAPDGAEGTAAGSARGRHGVLQWEAAGAATPRRGIAGAAQSIRRVHCWVPDMCGAAQPQQLCFCMFWLARPISRWIS